MGKAEGSAENWHGHVTAVTVAPEYRRLGLAAKLMHSLEDISEKYVRKVDSDTAGSHPNITTILIAVTRSTWAASSHLFSSCTCPGREPWRIGR